MVIMTACIVAETGQERRIAEEKATEHGRPLYIAAARDILSPGPGEILRLVDQQVEISRTGGAALLIQRADAFFLRDPDTLTVDEPLLDPRSFARKFTKAQFTSRVRSCYVFCEIRRMD